MNPTDVDEVVMLTKIRYGNTNTILLQGDRGSILIDTDYAGTMPAFYKAIKGLGIKVSDITYVLATHYHPDHIGLVSELMRDRSNPDDIITLSEA